MTSLVDTDMEREIERRLAMAEMSLAWDRVEKAAKDVDTAIRRQRDAMNDYAEAATRATGEADDAD